MNEALTPQQITQLALKANTVRKHIIQMLCTAGSGHTAGPLGMADIFTLLYFLRLKHDPKNPTWEDRDRLVLSNGHICPVQYVCLAMSGYFPLEELSTLRQINSRLQGHPHRTALPGLETTSGPLGEGLSQAIGMAMAARMDNKEYYTYCLTSDGEHQEGNTWEAALFAGKEKLNRLIQIIDRNYIQIDGNTEDIMPLDPLTDKYKAFNWHVMVVDPHDFSALDSAISEAKTIQDKPTIIIANTIPGKGVDFMEHDYLWHGKPPTQEEAEKALIQLDKIEQTLKQQGGTNA